MNTKTQPEKTRLLRRIPVYFGPIDPRYLGFIRNISAKTLAINSRDFLDKNSAVKIRINHENGAIFLRGVIKNAKRAEVGLSTSNNSNEMQIDLLEKSDSYLDFLHDILESDLENRRETRFDKVLKVTFENSDSLIEEYTHNISMGGMFIAGQQPLELNTQVEVRILIADIMKIIHAEAQVTHVVNPEDLGASGRIAGVGLQFMRFYDDDREALEEYVKRLEMRR